MSDHDDGASSNEPLDAGRGGDDRGGERGGERGPDRGAGRGERGPDRGAGRGDREGDRQGASDRGDGPGDQPREPSVFASAGGGPLGGEGDTGGAATARRAVRTWASMAGDRHTSIQGDGTVYEGNQFFSLYASDRAAHFVRGPVPPETLDHLGRVYCETAGYQRMKRRLSEHRVLVLCGEPGSGRKATALALLGELADDKVFRLDPRHGVDEITEEALQEGGGHLMELLTEDMRTESEPRNSRSGPGGDGTAARRPAARLSELHLDRFAELLRGVDAYGIVLVENGELADRLLRGRYGTYCPPPPADEVLGRHLRDLLRAEPAEALDAARALAGRSDVVTALGLEELRPREAARLADHLARHWRGEVTEEQLLADCASFVTSQAREWFAGADRPGTLPEALPVLNAGAFRIAVAVFDGSAYSLAAEAAELLAWELAVTLDPEHAPGRRLFSTHAEHRPVQARAVLEDGQLDLGPAKVPVRAVRFQGEALAGAVLGEIWHGYHNVRGPVARWLRSLCDDPRPEVWVRASIAAGVLCSWDWIHGFSELITPLAVTDAPVARLAAATALAESARDARIRPAVAAVLKDWAVSEDSGLVGTALLAHGYVLAAGDVPRSLDALARVVRVHEASDGDVLGPAAFSAARLLASGEPEPVLRRFDQWLDDGRLSLANLTHLALIRALSTRTTHLWGLRDVPELDPHAARPLLVALLATRPGLAPELARLLRHTLATARSGEVALEALGGMLRRAAKDEEALGHVCRFLPLLAVDRRDRDRLRGLLNELVRDRDRPLDRGAARRMWDAVTEGVNR
ncbi:nSTAND3 domain-containing NTPase [Streptomyces sp. NPDC055103]